MNTDEHLAAEIAQVIAALGPSSGSDLARRLSVRKAEVLRELRANPVFERVCRGRYTVWRLTGTGQEPMHEPERTEVEPALIHRLEALERLIHRLEALERRVEALEHRNVSEAAQ